jgi:hypothetical protein
MWNDSASFDIGQASLQILEELDLFCWIQLGKKL